MSIGYRAVGEGQANLAASVDITAPAGTKGLDFLLMGLSAAAARTFASTGWTRLPGATAGSQTDFFWKIATASEPSTYTATCTGGTTTRRGFVAAWSGVNPWNPFDGPCVINQPTAGTTNVIPQVSPTGFNRTLLSAAVRVGSAAALVPPGTMTQDFQVTLGTVAKAAAREIQIDKGNSGPRTWTWSGTSNVGACLMALRAAEDSVGLILM